MSFTGNEDHSISLALASEWTKNFRSTISEGEKIGGYFSKSAIESVLNQEEAIGLRYYFGIDDNKQSVIILTGVNSKGNDLYNGILLERALPCPPDCAVANPLNS